MHIIKIFSGAFENAVHSHVSDVGNKIAFPDINSKELFLLFNIGKKIPKLFYYFFLYNCANYEIAKWKRSTGVFSAVRSWSILANHSEKLSTKSELLFFLYIHSLEKVFIIAPQMLNKNEKKIVRIETVCLFL